MVLQKNAHSGCDAVISDDLLVNLFGRAAFQRPTPRETISSSMVVLEPFGTLVAGLNEIQDVI